MLPASNHPRIPPFPVSRSPIPLSTPSSPQFLKRVKDQNKSVYVHVTTAVDTSNVKFVFNAVISMLLETNLKDSGLM